NDLEGLSHMARRAYDRLVGSGKFSYRRFAEAVDETIRRKAKGLGVALRAPRYERGVARPVFDPIELASFREQPTAAPRHSAIFWCKQLARENVALKEEIVRLNEVYPTEIKRLNEVYPAEIERLNEVYQTEIKRLHQTYSMEVKRFSNDHSNRTHLSRIRWD